MSVEITFEINQQSSKRKEVTEELEDLQRDMVELNQVLGLIKSCSVKEVIVSETNLISAKIDSLKDLTEGLQNPGCNMAASAAVIRDSVISVWRAGGRLT